MGRSSLLCLVVVLQSLVACRTSAERGYYAPVGADLRRGKAMHDQLQKLSELSEKQAEEAQLDSQAKQELFAQSDRRLRKAEENTRDLVRKIVTSIENG